MRRRPGCFLLLEGLDSVFGLRRVLEHERGHLASDSAAANQLGLRCHGMALKERSHQVVVKDGSVE